MGGVGKNISDREIEGMRGDIHGWSR